MNELLVLIKTLTNIADKLASRVIALEKRVYELEKK